MTRVIASRRHTYIAWRRHLALIESRALRAYIKAGRLPLPACRPDNGVEL